MGCGCRVGVSGGVWMISDNSNLNPNEAKVVFDAWINSQTVNFMDPNNARFRIICDKNGILQAVKQ